MGLDTSHDCWSGPYSQFMRWREWIAAQVGIPLRLMDGFYNWTWEEGDLQFDLDFGRIAQPQVKWNEDPERRAAYMCHWDTLRGFESLGRGISWEMLNDNPLCLLLHHSDCDGKIRWWYCKEIAQELWKILRRVPDDTEYPKHRDTGEMLWEDWRKGRGIYDGNVPATKRFIVGLLKAHRNKQDLRFA